MTRIKQMFLLKTCQKCSSLMKMKKFDENFRIYIENFTSSNLLFNYPLTDIYDSEFNLADFRNKKLKRSLCTGPR